MGRFTSLWKNFDAGNAPGLGEKNRGTFRRAASDRKSTRLNSSHTVISYAVFCLKVPATIDIYTLSLHDALPILFDNKLIGSIASRCIFKVPHPDFSVMVIRHNGTIYFVMEKF